MTIFITLPEFFGYGFDAYLILIILGIPIFFVCKWLLKKIIKAVKTRKIATWAVTLILTPFIYYVLFILIFMLISYHPSYTFNQEKWLANKEKRYELSKDIIDSKMLLGKTKAEVRQILGDAENSDQSNYGSYYLGFAPGFANIDPDVLDIEFKNGKVIKVKQHET